MYPLQVAGTTGGIHPAKKKNGAQGLPIGRAHGTMFVCWAVLWAQHLCQSGQGWTWTNTTPVRFNVGLLVEAGDGGGGALVPGSCSWTSLFIFYCLGDVGEGGMAVEDSVLRILQC